MNYALKKIITFAHQFFIVENKRVIKLFLSKMLFAIFLILKFGRNFVASVAEECFYGKSCTFAASNLKDISETDKNNRTIQT